MTYSNAMEFIETPVFTRLVLELLPDDEYRELQFMLADNPSCGDIIQGGGGIRKVRFSAKGKGKSGGVRVIYYWMTARGQIYMLLIYSKNKRILSQTRKPAYYENWSRSWHRIRICLPDLTASLKERQA